MCVADWLRIILLSVIWGGSFLFNEIALTSAGTMTVVAARIVLAAVALITFCKLTGINLPASRKYIPPFLVMGLLNNVVPFTLIVAGQTQITGSLASILNATTPLFTVLVAHVWGRAEPATPTKIAGVLGGFAGVAWLMGADALSGVTSGLWGQVAVLLAALSYAVTAVYGRRFRDLPPAGAAAGTLTAATLMILPLAVIIDGPTLTMPDFGSLAAMLALALLCTAYAYILYFRVLATAGPTNLMLVTFLIPVSAILLGVTLLSEPLEAHHIGGLCLILAGLSLVDGRILRVTRRESGK